jgi:hypothetical protein
MTVSSGAEPAEPIIQSEAGSYYFAEALASEEEDLGVFHQAIGDGSGDGGVVEDVAPVGKCCVGRDERAALIAMASGDDLIEEVGSLLIERKVT